jgi:hypothetical protein
MGRQTTVQDSNTIRFGSAKIEAGANVGALTDLGAANNVVFNETWDNVKVMSANAGEIVVGVRNQMATVTFDMLEANLTNLNILRGGIDTYTATAAAPVAVTNENVVMTGVTGQRLAYKNGAGTIVTGIVVDNSGGVPYTIATDYYVGIDAAGYTVITRRAGGGIADGETVKVDYTYTPSTAKNLSSGGKFTMTPKVLRLTNTNEAGKTFVMTFYRVKSTQGIQLTLNTDDAVDPNVVNVQLEATRDESLTAGAQLFTIVDEQAP